MARRKKKKAHRTHRQRAASRRNIRKAQAAYRRKYGCKYGYKAGRKHCRKAYRTARQIAAANRNLRKARAAKRAKRRGRAHGKKRSRRREATATPRARTRTRTMTLRKSLSKVESYYRRRERELGAGVEGPARAFHVSKEIRRRERALAKAGIVVTVGPSGGVSAARIVSVG